MSLDVGFRSDSRMRNHVSVGSQPTTSSNSSEKRKVTKSGSDWRLTKMILAIFLSFIFCYLPTTIIKVVDRRVSYPGAYFALFFFLIIRYVFDRLLLIRSTVRLFQYLTILTSFNYIILCDLIWLFQYFIILISLSFISGFNLI